MPQLHIHFTDADIARTRLKLEIDLRWEIVSSVQVLQHADGGLSFDPWRRQVREHMSQDGGLRAAVQALMTVAPHAAYFPDFLTPTLDVPDIDTPDVAPVHRDRGHQRGPGPSRRRSTFAGWDQGILAATAVITLWLMAQA